MILHILYFLLLRRDVRAVEGARLESVCTLTRTEGSNPSLSAIFLCTTPILSADLAGSVKAPRHSADYARPRFFPAARMHPEIPARWAAPNLQADVIAGSRATASRELRQVRKEATAAAPAVCRGQTRLSYAPASHSINSHFHVAIRSKPSRLNPTLAGGRSGS